MKTVRVSLGLSRLTASQKVSLWGTIKADMTANSNFATPTPALATIDAQVVIFAGNISAANSGDHSKIAAMQAQDEKVDNLLNQLANYVELTANAAALLGADAVAIIKSAGMDVEAARSKSPVPVVPTGLKGVSAVEGDIELSWNNEKYARAFVIEISNDLSTPANLAMATAGSITTTSAVYINWLIKDICHKPKIILSGLTSGIKYAVRIIASGTAGKSAASTPVVVKVL